MFEAAELGRSLGREEYDVRVPALRTGLLRVQNELLRDAPCSVVIVIAGVDGAGKGDTVNTLHEWMDPRYLATHALHPLSEEERERPQMWRFWRVLPAKGRIGIFFGSWYTQPIIGHVNGELTEAEFQAELRRIQDFERMLAEDGTLVLKYWFHLSKKAQKRRLKKLSGDPALAWRVGPDDWKHFEMYDDFVGASERALRETSTGAAPWQVIEGAQARYRDVTCAEHLLQSLQARLQQEPERALQRKRQKRPAKPVKRSGQPTILDALDLTVCLKEEAYDEQLLHWQGRLNGISRKAQQVGATMLCVFEGPDAAGKGGAIRRVAHALDARFYRVISIAAPTDEEKAHHYLWRFWRHLPRAGHMVLFDRSWYGRLLVERVEGFATPDEWGRAYNEISEFEEALTEHGIGLAKFWLHIDLDEQARRFEEREKTSYKEFKITAEDYRNRKKWPLYEDAVHDMVQRTSNRNAPWTLIAANDKRHARIEVLKGTCEALERCVEATKGAKKQRKRR